MVIKWNLKAIVYTIVIVVVVILVYSIHLNITSQSISKQFNRKSSLTFSNKQFYLKDAPFQILSGSIHFFRVPPESWQNSLQMLKSAGLNTVESIVAWNLHEERKGIYNFDGNLNIRKFVQLAHEIGLYVILRPGPYVDGHLDFGGMPSWLLSDSNMKIRSIYVGFLNPFEEYIKQLMREINDLQYSIGGPIIAFQIEHEYSFYGNSVDYLESLKKAFIDANVVETMFLTNSLHSQIKLSDVFYGIKLESISNLDRAVQSVHNFDPDLPIFISDLVGGYCHRWGNYNQIVISDDDFQTMLQKVLKEHYSFNLYMFQGGTNYGFNSGSYNLKTDSPGPQLQLPKQTQHASSLASNSSTVDNSVIQFFTTSFDCNAPVSENGGLTNKFNILRKEILSHLADNKNFISNDIPEQPITVNYGDVELNYAMDLNQILDYVDNSVYLHTLETMEELSINGNSGQSFGFILYQYESSNVFNHLIIKAKIRDRAIIYLNGMPITNSLTTSTIFNNDGDVRLPVFMSTGSLNNTLTDQINSPNLAYKKASPTLDILVENMGRLSESNFQSDYFNQQRKGITGVIYTDSERIKMWKIFPLEFKKSFLNKLSSSTHWYKVKSMIGNTYPKMYKGKFILSATPEHTYISLASWTKGVVFVNGFNIGRYWNIGPIVTLFLHKSFLRFGENEIIIFELYQPGLNIRLQSNKVFLQSNSKVFI